MKEIVLEAPDSQLDASMKPLVEKWSTPPKAIEILEVLDWCIFSSLASGLVVTLLQNMYAEAVIKEKVSHEEMGRLAVWRKKMDPKWTGEPEKVVEAPKASRAHQLEPPLENPCELPEGSGLKWVVISFFGARIFNLYRDDIKIGWLVEGLTDEDEIVFTAFDNRTKPPPLVADRKTLLEASTALVRTMLLKIGPWEPHEKFAGTEVRKNLETGEVVADLFPEGRGESQCWVWRIDNRNGSKKDREAARSEVDKELSLDS
jgi:hypothetical protein